MLASHWGNIGTIVSEFQCMLLQNEGSSRLLLKGQHGVIFHVTKAVCKRGICESDDC